ncbi:MAG: AAA family ATPase [Candidatus Nomurabacteria bacterium]|nr:AAA family ATPase [Candidatus Nomurabacteria bacterium]
MPTIDHKAERDIDVGKIKASTHPRKVIVAGPGTGKSFLFQELIKEKKKQGKTDFVAITFIGKLGDALADDLCGLAETVTMHGFARKFVLASCGAGWEYYPRIFDVIKEDLVSEGITTFEIGDDNYKAKTAYYKAVGDADVVHYAVQICKKDNNKIPKHDLILVDEFQDFNAIESEFVDLLSQKNELVIVGDDDQALYEFKGSSPSYIRSKHNNRNTDFESHTLRFCSRCTEVIIKYFHSIVTKYNLNEPAKNRIQKEYICYVPDKEKDSKANPKINLITNCPTGMVAYKIKAELEKIVSEQKIKDVLVIGEGRSCKTILENTTKQLKKYGFKHVDFSKGEGYLNLKQEIVDAYKFIGKDADSLLGWRILGNPSDQAIKDGHKKNAKTLKSILNDAPSKVKAIKDSDVAELEASIQLAIVSDTEIRRSLLIEEIKNKNINLSRPLGNLNITVCNILNSKGLGADVVFVIGFDEGKFPVTTTPTDSEIYQLLVALTRAKKRIYFINTTGKKVSSFMDCIDSTDLVTEKVN